MCWVLEQPFTLHLLLWRSRNGSQAWLWSLQSPFCWCVTWHGLPVPSHWLVPLSQELLELEDWQGHMKTWSLNRGAQEMPPHWILPEDDATQGRNSSQQRGWLPWHRWPQAFRKFSELSWMPPYPSIKTCCVFFNVRLSVPWTRLNTVQWIWTTALTPLKFCCWCRL